MPTDKIQICDLRLPNIREESVPIKEGENEVRWNKTHSLQGRDV